MRNFRVLAVSLIIAAWGMFHFVPAYSALLGHSRSFQVAIMLWKMAPDMYQLAFGGVFTICYMFFWFGFSLLITCGLRWILNWAIAKKMAAKSKANEG